MDSTQSWTDPAPLLSALDAGAGRRLLWIGGSGDNALAAAIAGADVTISAGDDERALVELKREAARELDLGAYRELLGLGPPGRRIFYYHHVRKRLSPPALAFWDRSEPVLRGGVLDSGRREQAIARHRRRVVAVAHREATIESLFAAAPGDQATLYDRVWNTVAWRALSKVAASRSEIARAFRARAETLLRDVPIRGNYLLHAFLLGRYADLESSHTYFSRAGFDALRKAAIEITAAPAGDFDGIVLEGTARSFGRARPGTSVAWWGEATVDGVGDVRTLGPDRSPLDGPLRIGIAR
jgi:S-adenosylmethionine:diacylglycerol 3-amino-3-carboxypropyl transferase